MSAQPIQWRRLTLVMLVPGVLAVMALGQVWVELTKSWRTVPTIAVVAKVYETTSNAPWNREASLYAPVFLYTWSDGEETLASAGMRRQDWNFPIGTEMEIRYFPDWKGDVVIPGGHNWIPAGVMAAMALVTAVPGWALYRRLVARDAAQ